MVYVLAGEYKRDPEIAAIGFLDWETSRPQMRGGNIPASALPERLEIVSKAPMPDFFQWQADQFIVSDRFRKELERLAPGKFEYLPMTLFGPSTLNLTQGHYFINCLFSDQLIDWPKITPQHNYKDVTDPQGRRLLRAPLPSEKRSMHFKPIPAMHVWRERDIVMSEIIYGFYPGTILMTDDLWAQLDRAFPGQHDRDRRFRI